MGARDLRSLIREIPDFPEPGILFRDITPVMADPDALADCVSGLARLAGGQQIDVVVAAEARGFLLGPALALALGAGFALARKQGRLPRETVAASYALEYGAATIELHRDSVAAGARVLVHDDLLATGGTASALCELVEGLGGEVCACSFMVELASLQGRARLAPRPVHSLISYES